MRQPYLLDAALAERARAVRAGTLHPPPLRRAATVVLLRDGDTGIEAFLLRRVSSMAFAAGMLVFPGGAVDPRDADAHLAWEGPPAAAFGARFGCDAATARASVCAAVRETYEEAGVLLAAAQRAEVVAVPDEAARADDQRALLGGDVALSDLLARRGLVLRADLLAAWDHWVTPRFERRRYDTHFYVAAVPAGQEARHDAGEADRGAWARPADAVAAADAGTLPMLPPTRQALASLQGHARVADVLAAAPQRRITALLPGWVDEGEDVRLLHPADPGWPGDGPRRPTARPGGGSGARHAARVAREAPLEGGGG